MQTIQLGQSDLRVTPICLGTMTFGEQVNEQDAHAILDRAVARGINFLDTAEMYSVPPRPETYGATETIMGRWFATRPGLRQKVVLATKVAGPSRGMPWVRKGEGLTGADIVASCEASLQRLQTDVIDLYQIHWPERPPLHGARAAARRSSAGISTLSMACAMSSPGTTSVSARERNAPCSPASSSSKSTGRRPRGFTWITSRLSSARGMSCGTNGLEVSTSGTRWKFTSVRENCGAMYCA